MKILCCRIIKFYQLAVSPYLGGRCRFVPSCSAYMLEAIAKKGAWRGLGLGLKRLLKCHPLGGSGHDPLNV